MNAAASRAVTTSIRILGCRVDALTLDEAAPAILAGMDAFAAGGPPVFVVTIGTEMIMRAQHHAEFRDALGRATFSVCDTVGVLLASLMRRGPLRERVPGVALVDELCAALAARGESVFLLGASGDTAEAAARTLAERYPGLLIAGTHDGFFALSASDVVAAQIARSGARLLLVALGSPKQEMWIDTYLARTKCAAAIGVGGVFDVLAGRVPRAPEMWQAMGLEWLYRLGKEPRRWRRQLALPLFVVFAVGESVTQIFRRRRSHV